MTSLDESEVPSYSDLLRLDGRGVVVVGAGQGMGRQTAHAAHELGARVVAVDIEADLAKEIAAEVDGTFVVADARTRAGVETIVEQAVADLGRIDGLVDIIGMARWASLLDTTDEDWDWTFDRVLRHAFLTAQLVGRVMSEQGSGAMVFIASVSGMSSAPMHAPYGAAKAGVMSLVRTAAAELGPYGIRANAISPGSINTPRLARQRAENGITEIPPAVEPLGHWGQTRDIAGTALFLLSDLSRHITGQTLVVDGGSSVLFPYRQHSAAVHVPAGREGAGAGGGT
jgi:NAD(P)-dependent dehydrogenase (short-subunit alcohol dehydrogenase family)